MGVWNYNVSHHGEYVCIVSHPKMLVGIDIVDKRTRSPFEKSLFEFVNMFNCQLTATEIRSIFSKEDDDLGYQHFFIIWSLKESFSKAIGLGLGYDLTKANFSITYNDTFSNGKDKVSGSATVNVEGVQRPDWRFHFFSIDDNHIVSIALGPTGDVTSSYRESAWAASKARNIPTTFQTMPQSQDHIDETDATSIHYEAMLQFGLPPIHYKKISPRFLVI